MYLPQTYLTHCPQCVTMMHTEKGFTCSVVLLIIVERVPWWPHMKLRKIVRPPHPLIYIEPCSHHINIISQARMIPIEMGIDLKLVMQGTNDVLILLEQVLKILVVLTSSWHVWRRHMLLRHMLLRLLTFSFWVVAVPVLSVDSVDSACLEGFSCCALF